MPDIFHRLGIKSSPEKVYEALTTEEGLSGWWTTDTRGEAGTTGGVVHFRFGAGAFDLRVAELEPARRVVWTVPEGPPEWLPTKVRWELRQDGDYTIVLLTHEGWKERVEFMGHCSTKWATFLLSLKSLVEAGQGTPDPHDVKIDNWN
jgi:uncharacterized protein YndB with AHSA1/START domain